MAFVEDVESEDLPVENPASLCSTVVDPPTPSSLVEDLKKIEAASMLSLRSKLGAVDLYEHLEAAALAIVEFGGDEVDSVVEVCRMFSSRYPSFASEIYGALDRVFMPRNEADLERKNKCLQLLIKLYYTGIVDQQHIFAVILERFDNDIKLEDGSVVLATMELTTTFLQDAPLSKSDKHFGNSLPIELDRKQELLDAVHNIIESAVEFLEKTKAESDLGQASGHSEDYCTKMESAIAKASIALNLIEETGEGKTPDSSALTLKEGNEEKEERNEEKEEGNEEREEGKTPDTSALTLKEGNEETQEGNEGCRDADVQKLKMMKGKRKMDDRRGNIAWRLAEYEQLIKGMEKNLVDHPKEYFKYTLEEGKSIFHSVRTTGNLRDTWHFLVTKAQIPAKDRTFRFEKIPDDLMNKVLELESKRTKKSGAVQNSLPDTSESRSAIEDVTDPGTNDCDLSVDSSSPSPAINFSTDAAVFSDECSDTLEAGKRKF